MTIEGIPDGWEQERVGQIHHGEYWVDNYGNPKRWENDHPSSSKNYVIIRKKPKQYRPFANAAEFEPFRDRWVREFGCSHACAKVVYYDNTSAYIDCEYDSWESHFRGYTFDDGTPFGIEVTE